MGYNDNVDKRVLCDGISIDLVLKGTIRLGEGHISAARESNDVPTLCSSIKSARVIKISRL